MAPFPERGKDIRRRPNLNVQKLDVAVPEYFFREQQRFWDQIPVGAVCKVPYIGTEYFYVLTPEGNYYQLPLTCLKTTYWKVLEEE